MGKAKRSGNNRPNRSTRSQRNPELGYFLIVTDTKDTERLYLEGFRDALTPEESRRIVITVHKAKYTKDLVTKCKDKRNDLPQYCKPWILFDRDEVKEFDQLIEAACQAGIGAAWSNPCIEIWFQAYYGKMSDPGDTLDQRAGQCCDRFAGVFKRKTGQAYQKNDQDIYRKLSYTGDETNAVRLAAQRHKAYLDNGTTRPSEMCPCTTVYQLIRAMRGGKPA